MHDNNDFLQDLLLTQIAVDSINNKNYLRALMASIDDIRLRAKLEDDPRKQNILNEELNRLVAELNEYVAEQKRQRSLYRYFLVLLLFILLVVIASLWY
ncbi:MAG: hypothetical protein RL017_421 [Pseudomonadota bacterium]|jgi:hypothetical protein|nr:hypothetical protein [Burkholderiales bacterium]